MNVAVLMPAYDEGETLGGVLSALRAYAAAGPTLTVYLVDDGSTAPVDAATLPGPAARFSLVLARHAINLGQGAALETARQLALANAEHEVFVTMDADGQHRPEDIASFVAAVAAGADVVFGDRFHGGSRVPLVRALVLHTARLFERLLTGVALGDAHNGFRAFSRRALAAVEINQNRMAHATEIRRKVARQEHLVIRELPMTVSYSPKSLRKGQSAFGGLQILRDIFYDFLFGSSR